jgi:hypothetical protein
MRWKYAARLAVKTPPVWLVPGRNGRLRGLRLDSPILNAR